MLTTVLCFFLSVDKVQAARQPLLDFTVSKYIPGLLCRMKDVTTYDLNYVLV